MRPLVSVILPVFNGANFIKEAIASVQAQTFPSLELIIVDDESTDGSADIVREMQNDLRIRFCSQLHSGAPAARNLGIQSSSGKFLAFLDADDIWVKEKLEKQIATMESDPNVDMVFGHYREFRGELHQQPGTGIAGYSSGTMLIDRKAFLNVGLFSTQWRVGEFVDWYARAKEKGLRERMLPEVLLWRRLHSNNMGVRHREARVDYARVIGATIQRRRSQKSSTH